MGKTGMAVAEVEMGKRERLMISAAELFHRQGFANTSLKDIAEHSGVPVGNIYYYFKTKDELGIATALEQQERMLFILKEIDEKLIPPQDKIKESVAFYEAVSSTFVRFGCPIASMIYELNPKQHEVGKEYAVVYDMYVAWLQKQFELMTFDAGTAKKHAMQVLINIQGAGLMAKSWGNAAILGQQIETILCWIDDLSD